MSTSVAVSAAELFEPADRSVDALRSVAAGGTHINYHLEDIIRQSIAGGRFDDASVTTAPAGGTAETIVCTSELAGKLDVLQHDVCQGPCFVASRAPGIVIFDADRPDPQWPAWASLAAEAGVTTAVSIHLSTGSKGSLTLYSKTQGPISAEAISWASMLASHVSALMEFARTTANLRRAIDARNLIGQAQGVLMERHRLTAGQAFGVLSHYSQHHNIKVSVLAAELTQTGTLPNLDRSLTAVR